MVLGSGTPEGSLDRIWVSKNVVLYIGVHFFLCSFFIFWVYERFSQLSDILDLVPLLFYLIQGQVVYKYLAEKAVKWSQPVDHKREHLDYIIF